MTIRSDTLAWIRRNVNYVNQQMTLLERAGLENQSLPYRHVQDSLVNDKITLTDESGKVRFKAKIDDLQELTTNQLKRLQKNLKYYKEAKTGTLRRVLKFQSENEKKFREYYKNKFNREFTGSQEAVRDIFNHANYSRFDKAYDSDTMMMLIDEVGINEAEDIINAYTEETVRIEMDDRIFKELKKARRKKRNRGHKSNFVLDNNRKFWRKADDD